MKGFPEFIFRYLYSTFSKNLHRALSTKTRYSRNNTYEHILHNVDTSTVVTRI